MRGICPHAGRATDPQASSAEAVTFLQVPGRNPSPLLWPPQRKAMASAKACPGPDDRHSSLPLGELEGGLCGDRNPKGPVSHYSEQNVKPKPLPGRAVPGVGESPPRGLPRLKWAFGAPRLGRVQGAFPQKCFSHAVSQAPPPSPASSSSSSSTTTAIKIIQ